MASLFQKFGKIATIIITFLEAAYGSPANAVTFWVTLFSAAVMSEADDGRRNDAGQRLM